jgi:hypothetical protein
VAWVAALGTRVEEAAAGGVELNGVFGSRVGEGEAVSLQEIGIHSSVKTDECTF